MFANNAYTVVNFWFSGCKPCVAELGELDKLNQTAKQQGGEAIGINTETLDGNADAIATAKDILQTKGRDLPQYLFRFLERRRHVRPRHHGLPTTYVFDRNGNAVGEPLLGGIDNADNLAQLQKNIDAALAADQK
ncbi:MAG: TlpA disulfide reductase family protein [Butyricicoccaceae bacterium]